MPFGKHKGRNVTDLPDSYIDWLKGLEDLREPLRSEVAREWQRRFDPVAPPVMFTEAIKREALATFDIGFKARVMEIHPDHGGSTEQMQALNRAKDWLRQTISSTQVIK
jgi:hypothetical protein